MTGIALAVALAALGAQPAAASPAPFRIYQLNMCMWGARFYVSKGHRGDSTCFPNRYVSRDSHGTLHVDPRADAVAARIAEEKRRSILVQVRRWHPTAVTVNEACRGDIAKVAATLGYDYATFQVGAGTKRKADGSPKGRVCAGGRGLAVNAILAKRLDRSFGTYLEQPIEGNPYSHTRSLVCALEATTRTEICTAHLALPTPPAAGRLQASECRTVQRMLALPHPGVRRVFAGDTNMRHMRCSLAAGYFGLQDFELRVPDRTPQSGFQHIYYSDGFTRGSSCGQMHRVRHTDHQGFLLDLRPTPVRRRGAACGWRDVVRNRRHPPVSQSPPSGWALEGGGSSRLVLRGSSGALYQAWWHRGAHWRVQSLGGRIAGTPAMLHRGSRYYAFALAPSGGIWERVYDGHGWGSWGPVQTGAGVRLRARQGGGVSAAWIGAGPRIFYVSPAGHLIQAYAGDGRARSWRTQDLGAKRPLAGVPAAVYAGHRLDVFAIDHAGRVMQRTYRRHWDAWHTDVTRKGAGRAITARPGTGVAAASGLGHIRLFTVSPHGRLFQSWYDYTSGWHSQSLGGHLAGVPAVMISGGRIDVFGRSPAGNIYQRTYKSGWSPFRRIVSRP